MTEWQPIDSAPTDGSRILCAFDDGSVGICKWVDTSRDEDVLVSEHGRRRTYERQRIPDGYFECEAEMYGPIAWMPLPEPPALGKEPE